MDVLVGFLVGYYLGAKGGREKLDELSGACQTIAGSQEFQAVMTLASSLLARVAVERGKGFGMGEMVGDQLKQVMVAAISRKAA